MSDESMTWAERIAARKVGDRVVVAPRNQEQAGTITKIGRVLTFVRLDRTGEVLGFYRDEVFDIFNDGSRPCGHTGETTTRTAHGYLGDAPKGTVETLCADCGTVLATTEPTR